jgi:peptidoglycan DL-endopeptidase CwlO
MPSALVAELAAPIREVQSLVGPGWSSDPAGDPASALAGVRDALADVAAAAHRAWNHAGQSWTGAGADAAAEFAATTAAAAETLVGQVDQLGPAAQTAGAAVSRANKRLRDIVERFEARAAALEPCGERMIRMTDAGRQTAGTMSLATCLKSSPTPIVVCGR